MKKNIAFFCDRLALGGIGRAMINYVNMIDKEKYDVTLFLNKKDGIYLNDVSDDVRIISLNISESKNVFLRKLINAYKLIYFKLKYHNKFYFAANFNTTIKAEFYKKVGNNPKEPCACYCCIYKHRRADHCGHNGRSDIRG